VIVFLYDSNKLQHFFKKWTKKTVPKIIHQMWLDKKEMDNEGPPEGKTNPIYKKYIRSWKKK